MVLVIRFLANRTNERSIEKRGNKNIRKYMSGGASAVVLQLKYLDMDKAFDINLKLILNEFCEKREYYNTNQIADPHRDRGPKIHTPQSGSATLPVNRILGRISG